MRNTLQIECLVQAVSEYIEASQEEERERNAYEGRSWGYWGQRYVDAKETKAEAVQKLLDDYIDQRINARLCGATKAA